MGKKRIEVLPGRNEDNDRVVWRPVPGSDGKWIEPMNGRYGLGPEYKPVLTKHDFVQRYAQGEFGNRSPTWHTIEEYMESGDTRSLIHIRNRIAGGATWYDVPACRVERTFHEALATGLKPEQLYFSAMCPTEKTLMNGEFMIGDNGEAYLFYSTVKKPMRASLKEGGRQLGGVTAWVILQQLMNVRSFEWLQHLIWNYPGHVVEFTTLSTCWGTNPGYNTLYWEVRRY